MSGIDCRQAETMVAKYINHTLSIDELEEFLDQAGTLGERLLFLGDGMPVHRERIAAMMGERALFAAHDLHIADTTFADGESPLKESSRIELDGCMFKWKYPLWYAHEITVKNSRL